MVPESAPSRTIAAMDLLPINTLDFIALLLVIVAAVIGLRTGAIPQVLGLVAAGGAIVLIVAFAPELTRALSSLEQPARAIVAIGGAFLLVAMAQAIGSSLGSAASNLLGGGLVGGIDAALGALLGAAQALVVVWLIGGLLAASSLPGVAATAQTSTAVRWLLGVLPPPGEVIGEIGAIVDESGLPQVFSGLEPLPAPAIELPPDSEVAGIAARAIASTVRVQTRACAASFTGTAFAVADGYFLTNAHVVAGAERVTLRHVAADGEGSDARGEVVLFDPELDVALIHAPELPLPSMVLAPEAPGRGTVGATLGYPTGSGLTVLPAVVTAEIRARGRDLYGDDPVARDVLELRAAIEPGASGGPFVLANGTVGGLVFAESRTDEMVGYALDPADVAVAIAPGLTETEPVDTGPCIR